MSDNIGAIPLGEAVKTIYRAAQITIAGAALAENRELLEQTHANAVRRLDQIETQMNATGNAAPAAISEIRHALVAFKSLLKGTTNG